MSQSLSLLGIDAFLLTLDGCAVLLFLYYLYQNRKEGYEYLRPAIALLVLWTGDSILRAPNWLARLLLAMGITVEQSDAWMIIGGGIKAVAYLCIIKVFSPIRWGKKSWIAAFLLALTFTLATYLVVYWENQHAIAYHYESIGCSFALFFSGRC